MVGTFRFVAGSVAVLLRPTGCVDLAGMMYSKEDTFEEKSSRLARSNASIRGPSFITEAANYNDVYYTVQMSVGGQQVEVGMLLLALYFCIVRHAFGKCRLPLFARYSSC